MEKSKKSLNLPLVGFESNLDLPKLDSSKIIFYCTSTKSFVSHDGSSSSYFEPDSSIPFRFVRSEQFRSNSSLFFIDCYIIKFENCIEQSLFVVSPIGSCSSFYFLSYNSALNFSKRYSKPHTEEFWSKVYYNGFCRLYFVLKSLYVSRYSEK